MPILGSEGNRGRLPGASIRVPRWKPYLELRVLITEDGRQRLLRVDKQAGPLCTVITLDGEISEECVDFIESCCERVRAAGKPVELFLRDVSRVDAAGRALLSRLAAQGIHLLGRGVYTSYLIRAAIANAARK